jgi:hypothetical protein
MNLSHIYEYLVVTESHVTGNFALTGATACCVCGTGTYESDANSSTVCMDDKTCREGNYTSDPGNNTLNPKCHQCEASKFKEDEHQHRRSGNVHRLCSVAICGGRESNQLHDLSDRAVPGRH